MRMNKLVVLLLLCIAAGGAYGEVIDVTPTSATITATSDAEVQFTIRAGTLPDDLYIVVDGGTGTSTSVTLSELQEKTQYYYVIDRCAGEACTTTEADSFTTVSSAPAPAVNITDIRFGWRQAEIDTQSDMEVTFTLLWGTNPDEPENELAGEVGTSTAFLLADLDESIDYYVVVEGCTEDWCSYSDVYFINVPDYPLIEAETTDVQSTSATIFATSDREATFLLAYSTDDANLTGMVEGGTSTSTSLTLSNLAPSTTYYYVVRGCTEQEDCMITDIMNFTTLQPVKVEKPRKSRSGGGSGGGYILPQQNSTNSSNSTPAVVPEPSPAVPEAQLTALPEAPAAEMTEEAFAGDMQHEELADLAAGESDPTFEAAGPSRRSVWLIPGTLALVGLLGVGFYLRR
jgi:hypothetical protein